MPKVGQQVKSSNLTEKILVGEALTVLKTLPEKSVHCCITSPPYWGLRDYGTAKWEGGSKGCDHKGPPFRTKVGLRKPENVKNLDTEFFRDVCGKCGARRIDSQSGLEKTPDCGKRGFVHIKCGLTEDQLKYVFQKLLDAGLLDADFCGISHKE
jgi:hypothetical protein